MCCGGYKMTIRNRILRCDVNDRKLLTQLQIYKITQAVTKNEVQDVTKPWLHKKVFIKRLNLKDTNRRLRIVVKVCKVLFICNQHTRTRWSSWMIRTKHSFTDRRTSVRETCEPQQMWCGWLNSLSDQTESDDS